MDSDDTVELICNFYRLKSKFFKLQIYNTIAYIKKLYVVIMHYNLLNIGLYIYRFI